MTSTGLEIGTTGDMSHMGPVTHPELLNKLIGETDFN